MDTTGTIPNVAVVGAGVIGLSTATLFQDKQPNAKVTLIAEKFLTETTSDGAAGLFRPGTFAGSNVEITRKWIRDSYDFFHGFLLSSPEEAFEAGICRLSGYFMSSKNPSVVENLLLKELLPDYRNCTPAELKMFGKDFKYGTFCTTILTDCRKYLPYLTKKFKSKGGKIIQKKLESFDELTENFDIVFNCSGLGAKNLCSDRNVTSIRGQVYKVKAPWLSQFVYADYDVYIIPGMNSVTLGGVRQFDSLKEEVDEHDSKAIWERCVAVMPGLKNAEIEREWVGFRPYRSHVRVETEKLTLSNGRTINIVHNYGHGGYGVMTSFGTSLNAVQLGIECLQEAKSFKAKL